MGKYTIPKPDNEPHLEYEEGSEELKNLKAELERQKGEIVDIPLIIDGKRIMTDNTISVVSPHDTSQTLAHVSRATEEHILEAIEAAMEAQEEWASMDWNGRVAIFLKAADLLSGLYRAKVNAATMLGQSKTRHQAEIDSAMELIDFFRYNAYFMQEIYEEQPESSEEIWNRIDYRPLEGFIMAIPPFNFTSISGNLPTAPAMMGNTVLWKPDDNAVLASYYVMELLEEAGLPSGVINFIPAEPELISNVAIPHEDLAGIHFTGSVETFKSLWKNVANNLDNYNRFPTIVGETGGKDFVMVHPSADVDGVTTALIRASFQYAGQKCSASSRAYIPKSMWDILEKKLTNKVKQLQVGNPDNEETYVNALISEAAYNKVTGYLDYIKESDDAKIIIGGGADNSEGYFVEPTLVRANDPKFKTMREEIFGPVLTIYVYEDDKYEETLELCDNTSPYGLTGSIFAKDREAIVKAEEILRWAAGNFYINDKPTAAVVNQQPFGGARLSGTNDKAGSKRNLERWISPRAIKETFVPPVQEQF